MAPTRILIGPRLLRTEINREARRIAATPYDRKEEQVPNLALGTAMRWTPIVRPGLMAVGKAFVFRTLDPLPSKVMQTLVSALDVHQDMAPVRLKGLS